MSPSFFEEFIRDPTFFQVTRLPRPGDIFFSRPYEMPVQRLRRGYRARRERPEDPETKRVRKAQRAARKARRKGERRV